MVNITVAVPTLNERENLPDLFDCLKEQLYENDEVLLVDGGSDDGTVEYANEAGARVLVAEGSSVGQARNIAADYAENEVIATTDADSRPPDGWLETIRSKFANNPNLTVLWGDIVDTNGVPIRNLVGKFSTVVGGASGNNTAFRKEAFEDLKSGYPDVNFMEDQFIIAKLASIGEAERDKNLKMRMNMDRGRYQTVPMVLGGLTVGAIGRALGGDLGKIASTAGLGAAGTELFYEDMTVEGSGIHHDQIGFGVMQVGNMVEDSMRQELYGLGSGIVVHHVLTEGLSMQQTELMQNTDRVVGGGMGT